MWCQDSNLSLNVIKTKEMIVYYRKRRTKQVENFKFPGVHITKLTWSKDTKTVVKRARQYLIPLRRLKIFGMVPQKVLKLHHREHPDWLHHCLV